MLLVFKIYIYGRAYIFWANINWNIYFKIKIKMLKILEYINRET